MGETGFDNIDAHLVEQRRDLDFFLVGHGRAGGIAHRRGAWCRKS